MRFHPPYSICFLITVNIKSANLLFKAAMINLVASSIPIKLLLIALASFK
jgi:hypothetical protein